MLVIREEQYRRLLERQRRNYTEWALDRVRADYAEEYARMGEHGSREFVQAGMAKADQYGIQDGSHVLELIDMMFAWGRDFDLDLPWAGSVLRWDVPGRTKIQALRNGPRA